MIRFIFGKLQVPFTKPDARNPYVGISAETHTVPLGLFLAILEPKGFKLSRGVEAVMGGNMYLEINATGNITASYGFVTLDIGYGT